MKKYRIYLVLVLLGTLFILTSCAKAREDRCAELLDDVSVAATAFGNSFTEETCNAYFEAIQDYYEGCDNIPASYKATYDDVLDNYDCSGF